MHVTDWFPTLAHLAAVDISKVACVFLQSLGSLHPADH